MFRNQQQRKQSNYANYFIHSHMSTILVFCDYLYCKQNMMIAILKLITDILLSLLGQISDVLNQVENKLNVNIINLKIISHILNLIIYNTENKYITYYLYIIISIQ